MKKLVILLVLIGGVGIAYFLLQAGPEEKKIRELLEQTREHIENNDCAEIYKTLADGFVVPDLNLSKDDFDQKTFPQFSDLNEIDITKIDIHDIVENSAKASLIVKIVDDTLGYYSTLSVQIEFVKENDQWFYILVNVKPFSIKTN